MTCGLPMRCFSVHSRGDGLSSPGPARSGRLVADAVFTLVSIIGQSGAGLRWNVIADADFGQNKARVGGVGFQFAAQAIHSDLQHVTFTNIFRAPDML